jgi:hypothetical protein
VNRGVAVARTAGPSRTKVLDLEVGNVSVSSVDEARAVDADLDAARQFEVPPEEV